MNAGMQGFAKLGDQTAEDIRPATSFGFTGRIHPTRNFFPGQVYTPQVPPVAAGPSAITFLPC